VIDKIKGKIEWVKSTDFLAGSTLFFASIFFFYDLFGGRYLLSERDLSPYFIPPRFFWVDSIKQGSFPLWNPYQFSGHPFFANPQNGMLYPLNGLFFLFPFDTAFNAIIIIHFFLSGLFTYLLLRDLKVSPTGALVSGLVFMLSGYLLSVHSLLTILLSSAWTPLIIMFFRRAILKPGAKNEVFTAIFVTFSFFGGGIEIVYGNFIALLIMVIFSPYQNPPFLPFKKWRLERFRPILIRMRSLFAVSIIFLFLSAVQLFPFLELFHHSIRGSGMSYQEATIWSFAPQDVLLFFLPDAYGYFLDMKKYWVAQCWFKTLYTGGLPFILSIIFFIFRKDRKLYLALMLFSLFLSMGKYNPFYPFVFKYIPFFDGIRYPAKFLYIFILVLSVTAGLGFQKLSEFSKDNEKKKLKHFLLVFSLVSGFLLLLSAFGHKDVEQFLRLKGIDSPNFNILAVNLHHAQRFLFYLALFFLVLRAGYEVRWKVWIRVLLAIFLMTDLFGNMGFYGKEKTEDYFRKTKALEMISSDRDFSRLFSTAKTIAQDTTIIIGDPASLNILKEKNLPSMNLLFQLHDTWGIDVIRLKRADDLYRAFTSTPSILATHLIDLYGVKYITSVTPLEEDNKFELIDARLEGLPGKREDLLKENTIKLYRNRNPLPRAWLVKNFKVVETQAILQMMIQKDFRPGQEVLLEEKPRRTNPSTLPLTRNGGNLRESHRGCLEPAQIMSESNNGLSLLVSARENSLLVVSDTYYPGWKAFVNGEETKIYRADYAFRAIPLDAGTHRVEFIYDPISLKLGAGGTLVGSIGCVVLLLTPRRNRSGHDSSV
jgi:hypothetical protein